MAEENKPLDSIEFDHKKAADESEPEKPETPLDRIKKALTEVRRFSTARTPARREMGKDRTKSLVLLAGAAVGMVLMFLGVFSSPQKPQKVALRQMTPDLGRRVTPGQPAPGAQSGSVTPLMNVTGTGSGAGADGNQLTAADIDRTGRIEPGSGNPKVAAGSSHSLGRIDFSDPALQRQYDLHGYVPAPPPPAAETPKAAAVVSEDDDLKKPSFVFVRTAVTHPSRGLQAHPVIETDTVADLLPAGTRLVARLEAPVSTAVKAPVAAVVEYNYEDDGEIILPAGSLALGELENANAEGYLALHFDRFELPDGTVQKADAGAMGLDYKPLKGYVTGRKRGLRFLVESLTGIGTVAAYTVGNAGAGINAPFSSSALLREQLATNMGMAGQNQLNEMAMTQNVVVTVPGNTRFYLVLEKGSRATARPARPNSGSTSATATGVPSLEELRQLLELKREMSQMAEPAASSSSAAPQQ
jgi:hypothetical protein